MKRGKLIVIESLGDNFGKTTISEGLKDRIDNSSLFNFPSDLTPAGIFINDSLKSSKINLLEIDPKFLAFLYLIDFKIVYEKHIKPELASGNDVILDRYYFSTIVYESALNEIQGNVNRLEFINYVRNSAEVYHGLPIPDIMFILEDPFEASNEYKEKKDTFEGSSKLQHKVRDIGEYVISKNMFPNIDKLNISGEDGIRYTVEENLSRIINKLEELKC